jgi:uncharacterized membrane protein YfcA
MENTKERFKSQSLLFSFQNILVFGFGLITGTAAGLIGVGGGEFRLPVLLHLFKQRPKTASAINLLVGLFTVTLSLIRRWTLHEWHISDVFFVMILATASIFGAVAGAKYAAKLSNPFIKRIIYIYLLIVGAWMLFESITQTEHFLFAPQGAGKLFLGGVAGIAIAFISAIFGVAGGEMRIPALIYLFAIPIKEAGTISLAASVTTVAAGAKTYHSLGHLPKESVLIVLLMGIGSLGGVLIGTSLVPLIDKHLLKGVLGVILLFATLALAWSDMLKVKPSQ